MSGRVLIVDDEAQIRRALSLALGGHGYEVELAEDGETALAMIAARPPDGIVLDLMMPGIDGLEVLRRLRGWSETPVIVLSARGQERDKVQALDLGADDYLTKPFGIDELLARVRAVLRRTKTPVESLERAWGGYAAENARQLRVYINYLRRKLEDDPAVPKWIVTEPGVGYRLRA
jgi:two-component system, OmpR family, KDP operon response regulator KdpE